MKSDWARGCNPVIGAWLINALSCWATRYWCACHSAGL